MSFLGNQENSKNENIKKKYISLIKSLHPDKLSRSN